MTTLQDKVAIVTGGSNGIGEATARKLAEKGAKVVILDIDREQGLQVSEEIEGDFYYCDISNEDYVQQCIEKAHQKHGQIDIVFANGGMNGKVTPIEDMDLVDWKTTMETNLQSTFLTVKHAIPYMKENGGSIIITSSINGNRTFNSIGMSAYSTSKAGQTAFTKMASLELATYNIRVNSVHPGAIDTDISERTYREKDNLEKVQIDELSKGIHPLKGKPGKPEDVANLVCFLASDEANHISGTEVYVDGCDSLV